MMKILYYLIRHVWLVAGILFLTSTALQLQAQTELYGPETPPPKGGSITYTGTSNDGQIGFADGKTFTIQAISLAATTNVFWTMAENSIYLSMDGGEPYTAQEILDFNAAISNLPNGVAIWEGSTQIPISNGSGYTYHPLLSRFIMTVRSGGSPVNLGDPTNLGLGVQCGGVAQITGFEMVLTVQFEMFVSDNGGTTWTPHLQYYNNAATPPAIESAYSGFNYEFYWENDPPELSKNTGASVDEGDTVYIDNNMLMATDVESNNEDLRFVIDPNETGTLPANGVLVMDDEMVVALDSISLDDLMTSTIYYAHDGSETLKDSIPFEIVDSDNALCDIDGNSLFYFVFEITPVDDPPTKEINTGGEVIEGESLVLDEAMLKFTDPESGPAEVTYTLDPEENSEYPMNGLLKVNDVPLADGGTFTQADIAAGKVIYVHDGTETLSDGFIFQVADGFGHLADNDGSNTFFFEITIETVNDDPKLTKLVTLELDEGGTGIVGNMVLAASDEESPAEDVMFTLDPNSEVEEPNYGKVYLDGVLLNDGESFSMADVNSNIVTYVHDGSENFNDFFLFNVSDPDGGVTHDGEFTLFHFNLAMTNVNDEPTLENAIDDMTIHAAAAFSYTFPENTFADVDEGDEFTYTATQPGEVAFPGWLEFAAETRTFSGTPAKADMGTLTIVLTATDNELAEARDTFDITVIQPLSTGNLTLDEAIVVGPNPFSEVIHVTISKELSEPPLLTVFNVLGHKLVLPESRQSGRISLNVSDLPAGIYFIRIEADGEKVMRNIMKN